jgi:type I restriction enzyme S subunit
MTSEWNNCRLIDIVDPINTGLDAIKRAPIVSESTGIKCLRIQDISNTKTFENWGNTKVEVVDYEKYRLRKGEIIMARTCSTGICFLVPKDLPAVFNNGLARIRARRSLADPSFLYFIFKSTEFSNYIDGISGGTSVQLNMKVGDLGNYRLLLPSIQEQRRIAHILGTLDDKIELNRRMNVTLEEMARALFKSFFVDFDPVRAKQAGKQPAGMDAETAALFPEHFDFKADDVIPTGWQATTLGEVIEISDSKRVPLSGRQRQARQGKYPYHGAASVMDFVDDYLFDGIYALMGEDGSVINDDGTPVLQYVWGKFWVNNHAHVLRGKRGISTEHILLHLKGSNIAPFVNGAVQPKLNQGNMSRIPFMLPPPQIANAFTKTIEPLFAQFRANTEQSRTLAALRDTLLPKLLSGEISVADAEAEAGKGYIS